MLLVRADSLPLVLATAEICVSCRSCIDSTGGVFYSAGVRIFASAF